MKLYLAIKHHPAANNRAQIEAITDILLAMGHQVTCLIRDLEAWGSVAFPPAELMRHVFLAIEAADLVLVELSEKGVGLGIEAGYAHALGIPIVVIARQGSDISTTLQGIATQVLYYDTMTDLARLDLAGQQTHAPRSIWNYAVSSVERLLACLDDLEAAARNWRPLPNSNSLNVLATHLIGNIEETVWGVICGEPVTRDRDAEFQAQDREPAMLRHQWQSLREQIETTFATMSAADFARSYTHPRRGRMRGHQILIVVARHAAEHLAEAEMTRALWLGQAHGGQEVGR